MSFRDWLFRLWSIPRYWDRQAGSSREYREDAERSRREAHGKRRGGDSADRKREERTKSPPRL